MRIVQSGFSLISAIFLLVVLAFLGVAMTSFSTIQSQGAAMDVMGSRAYQAARAGIEWAAYYVHQAPAGTQWGGCGLGLPVAVSGDLTPFSPVAVNCVATSYTEGAATIWIYTVTSTAHAGGAAGDPNFVERSVAVKLLGN